MKLSLNCEATYLKGFIVNEDANELFVTLTEIVKNLDFRPQTTNGKVYEVNFEKIMFVDQYLLNENRFPEQYWGPVRTWTDKLSLLKERIEHFTNEKFQVCVLIYYPDGNSGVDFHSDFVAFGNTSIIPSISLGEERAFKLREKSSGEKYTVILEHGSLIIMGEYCQERYEHSLPIDPKYKNPRINLTFRKYGFDD